MRSIQNRASLFHERKLDNIRAEMTRTGNRNRNQSQRLTQRTGKKRHGNRAVKRTEHHRSALPSIRKRRNDRQKFQFREIHKTMNLQTDGLSLFNDAGAVFKFKMKRSVRQIINEFIALFVSERIAGIANDFPVQKLRRLRKSRLIRKSKQFGIFKCGELRTADDTIRQLRQSRRDIQKTGWNRF